MSSPSCFISASRGTDSVYIISLHFLRLHLNPRGLYVAHVLDVRSDLSNEKKKRIEKSLCMCQCVHFVNQLKALDHTAKCTCAELMCPVDSSKVFQNIFVRCFKSIACLFQYDQRWVFCKRVNIGYKWIALELC